MRPKRILYPDAYFAVISDLHVYDPSLGSSGAAFEEALCSDRKHLLESIELLDYAIGDIIASGVRFVLIPGDLTKDGELVNHRILAEKLKRFSAAGIAVYVIPGNHDINNPDAVSHNGSKTTPVPSISAEEFASLYRDFGYNAACMRDTHSLSYVVEPTDGLWLLALDCCRYRENRPGKRAVVPGRIRAKTEAWINDVLKIAAAKNKAVIAMAHHGVVEHWKGQAKLNPDFLLEDYRRFGKFFADNNVRFVFTGHYHAQDIAAARFGDNVIYDIETGSLSAAPCPIRYLEFKDKALHIRTQTIADKVRPGTDFAANADAFIKKNYRIAAERILARVKVNKKDRDYIAGAIADAFAAHANGDENPALRPAFDRSRLGPWGRFISWSQQYVLDGLWTNIPPADNDTVIELY